MIKTQVEVGGDDGPCSPCEGEVCGFIFRGVPASLTLVEKREKEISQQTQPWS